MGQLRITFWNDDVRVGKEALSTHRGNRHRSAAKIGHTNYGQSFSMDRASDNFHVSLNGEFYPRSVTKEMPQLHAAGYRGHDSRVHGHHAARNRDVNVGDGHCP